ncbi:MAG: beta-N-acetylglucosaminidase domain-containing protein, partial [Bacilli bacterium]
DVKLRGFIEGYYGNPWSNTDRADLMEFGGDYKLNQYLYAPKNDPKHNEKWRELYTEAELVEIRKLAEAGNKSKCYYVYALHPLMYNPIRFDSNYASDLNIIKAKLSQLLDAGVKQFSILGDDASVPGGKATNYVTLLNDLTEWLKEEQKDVEGLKTDVIFCPGDYMGNGSSPQMQALKALPESTHIIETGGKIWGEVSTSFTEAFYNNMGRPAYMWINWPCSDKTKEGLIMGGAETVLKPGVDPAKISGVVLNPMQQSEPSKQAIFTGADYAWKIWDKASDYDQVWNDSFHYMDHGTCEETDASLALRELSKHMKNSTYLYNEESEDLKPKLNNFLNDFKAGKSIKEQAKELLKEFEKLDSAAKIYRKNAGNKRTRDQIVYWLDTWDDTNKAIINYLNAAIALEEQKDSNTVWEFYSSGQGAFSSSKTHGFNYIDHTEYAKVGRMHITPFMEQLDRTLAPLVEPLVNPYKQIYTTITNRTDAPATDGPLSNLIDGNPSTCVKWRGAPSQVGEYIGATFTQSIKMNKVEFQLGDSLSNSGNTYYKAKLEYTENGKDWVEVPNSQVNNQTTVIKVEGLDLNVKGIRVVCMEETPKWITIREIYINNKPLNDKTNEISKSIIKSSNYSVYGNSNPESNLNDGDESTFVWYRTSDNYGRVGDFVGMDLGEVFLLKNAKFKFNTADYWDQYALEYSIDGKTYTKVEDYKYSSNTVVKDLSGIQARYVRLVNTKEKKTWLKINEFNVEVANSEKVYTNSENLKDKTVEISENKGIISHLDSITLKKDEYIGIKLLRIKDLLKIEKDIIGGDNLIIQTSINAIEWVNVDQIDNLQDARYIRLLNKSNNNITFTINQFEVISNEIVDPYLYETNYTDDPDSDAYFYEDSRFDGKAFNGNLDDYTVIAERADAGKYIIYDLGQTRSIDKVQLYNNDNEKQYLRDAEILISNNLNDWTKVATIGDGIANSVDDRQITCVNSGLFKTSMKYPNKMYIEGTADHVQARYVKIAITAKHQYFTRIGEIIINEGEYAPTVNDPTFQSNVVEAPGHTPGNMVDNDLSTYYTPNTKEAGELIYKLSDKLNVQKINLLQPGKISHAKVLALVDAKKSKSTKEWVEVGTLSKSLNEIYFPFWDNVYELKIQWNANNAPEVSEMYLLYDGFGISHDELTTYINSLNIVENEYTKKTYQDFLSQLDVAKKVNTNNNSTQSQINEALSHLKVVVNKLEKRGNLSAIQDELDEIHNLVSTDYTVESWNKFSTAIKGVEEKINSLDVENITEDEVDIYLEEIKSARSALITVIQNNKEVIQKYIADNKLMTLNENHYMSKTFKSFKDALDNMNNLLTSDIVTANELETALNQLRNARLQLILKASKEDVEKAKQQLSLYVENNYTTSSWQKFMKSTESLRKQMSEKEISLDDYQLIIQDMNKASKNLIRVGDVSSIHALLTTISGLDKTKYTQNSYQNLMTIVNGANEELKNAQNMSQLDVDNLLSSIQFAYQKLEVIHGSQEVETYDSTNTLFIIVTFIVSSLAITAVMKKKKD